MDESRYLGYDLLCFKVITSLRLVVKRVKWFSQFYWNVL